MTTARERKAELDSAEWRITLGALAGAGLALLRAFGLFALLVDDDRPWLAIVLTLIELVLCVFCAFRLQARKAWAAITLLVVWALGFANAWIAADSPVSPFALLSILVGVGLVIGVTGIYDLRRASGATANDSSGA